MFKKKIAEKEIFRIEKELQRITESLQESRELAKRHKDLEIKVIWDDKGFLIKESNAIENKLYQLEKKRQQKIKKLLSENYDYFQIRIEDLLDLMRTKLMEKGDIGNEENQSIIMRKTAQDSLIHSKKFQPIYKATYEYGLMNLKNNKEFLLPQITVCTSNPKLSAEDLYVSPNGNMNVLENRMIIGGGLLRDEKSQDEIMKMVEKNIHKSCEKPLREVFNDDFFLN